MGLDYTASILRNDPVSKTNPTPMNPDEITIDSMGKLFAYEKIARDIEAVSDVEELRNLAKSFAKLYYKQQEVVAKLGYQ